MDRGHEPTERVRQEYERLLTAGASAAEGRPVVTLLASTLDMSLGRGDIYVAVGFGKALAQRGYGVNFLATEDWYDSSRYGDVVVAMLPTFDARRAPAGPHLLAWVRNSSEQWGSLPWLNVYDGVLSSSELSRRYLARTFDGPTAVVPIGFDPDLFTAPDPEARRDTDGVTSANHWGRDRDVHLALRDLPSDAAIDWYGENRSGDRRLGAFNRGVVSYFDLPGIYRRSRVTVDDVNHVSVGFGNLNSRLFEALASGSLVTTNTRLGLAELGLDELPVYRSPSDLVSVLERADDDEFAALARRCSEIVHSGHTFAHRAEAFDAFLEREILGATRPRYQRTLAFFPDYTPTNPYQRMLYAAMDEQTLVVAAADMLEHAAVRDDGGDLSHQTLHVHWQNTIVQPASTLRDAVDRLDRFERMLSSVKERGARVVWTIHNAMPHELRFYHLELEVCRLLSEAADVIHVLSEATYDAVRELYPLDPSRTVVVPHSSYAGVYPELLDRVAARERLGISEHAQVLLLFGGIRPYKGLDRLLEAYEVLEADDASVCLLIAGNPGRTTPRDLLDRIEGTPGVMTRFEFIPDEDVHLYFRAADVQVAPYTAVLNSGSALLGSTFGLPIVVPDAGALSDMAGEPFVFAFDEPETDNLVAALHDALRAARDPKTREASLEYATSRSPEVMAEQFARALGL